MKVKINHLEKIYKVSIILYSLIIFLIGRSEGYDFIYN